MTFYVKRPFQPNNDWQHYIDLLNKYDEQQSKFHYLYRGTSNLYYGLLDGKRDSQYGVGDKFVVSLSKGIENISQLIET